MENIIQKWASWGCTQRQISQALGVSIRTVQDWAQGRRRVPEWVEGQLPPDLQVLFSEWQDLYDEPGLGGACVSYPAALSWRHAACHYGKPVVIIDGNVRGPGEMPPGELQVPRDLLEIVRGAGYQAVALEKEDRKFFWKTAKRPKVLKNHWHPEARAVFY